MPFLGQNVIAAADALLSDPLAPALQGAFEQAVRDQRAAEIAASVVDPIGTTYPRTSRSEFTRSEIIQALAYGIVTFGRDNIAWTRLTTDAFRPVGGGTPQWVVSTGAQSVFAGLASTVESWRKAIVDRATGYVSRFDTKVSLPVLSFPYAGQLITHPRMPQVQVLIDQDGFPVFSPAAEVMMPYERFRMSDRAQFGYCNRQIWNRVTANDTAFMNALPPGVRAFYLGSKPGANPRGWVWHHHQDAGRMQLVRVDDHDAVCKWKTKHTGGAAIWCADFRHQPRDAQTGKPRRHIFKTRHTISDRDRKRTL